MPYTEEDLREAIEAVAAGQSIRKTALTWDVPRVTLQDRLHSSESKKQAHSYEQRLPPHQEQRLVDWILLQGLAGHPPTHAQIRDLATRILATAKDTNPLGKKWMQSFLKRHPEIRTTRKVSRDSRRINKATTEVIRPWFNRFYAPDVQTIKPANRWNIDEAGLIEGAGVNGLVVGRTGIRSLLKKTPGSKAWTSFIECVSATGTTLPPLVIFKGKSVQKQWFPDDLEAFKDWHFTATPNA